MIYRLESLTRECYKKKSCKDAGRSQYYYVFGVDNDKRVFVNRVISAPDMYDKSVKICDNIELRFVGDHAIRGVMGYIIDYGDKEDVTVNLEPDAAVTATIRMQGDIVLALEPLTESKLLEHIDLSGIIEHARLLLIDVINRILLDNGLSGAIWRNSIVLENAAPRRKAHAYQHKVLDLLARELKEFLGDVDVNENLHEIRIKHSDFIGFIVRVATVGGGFGNPYSHILLDIDRYSWDLQNSNKLVKALQNDLLKEFENMQFMNNVDFSLGNHHIRISNTKPLSLIYRPSRQPLTLNENTISVTNPLTFIVTPDSIIELSHKEHGLKIVRFKNNYILTFRHVNTQNEYLNERNRVILRNLKL
jgi:hypothetical protein